MDLQSIYQRHADSVYKICFMFLKDPNDAEDAVQTTFVNLLDHPRDFENPEHERAWLIVTASNVCKNQLKHWFRKKRTDFDTVAPILSTENAESSEVLEVLLGLPEEYKTILFMYYYEGYSTDEIAAHLKINASTLRSKLVRGRELMKDVLRGSDEE